MIEDSGSIPSDAPPITENRAAGNHSGKVNWVEAILGLLESRAAIISLEGKEVLNSWLAKFIPLAVCLFCVIASWVLVIAAAIGCLAACMDWKWHQITFVMAGLHLAIAVMALLIAKKRQSAPFPVTRAEFEKDREWLIQLKNRND